MLCLTHHHTHHKNYTLTGVYLETVHNHAYLGVTLDDKLNWNSHVDNAVPGRTVHLSTSGETWRTDLPTWDSSPTLHTYDHNWSERYPSRIPLLTATSIHLINSTEEQRGMYVNGDYGRRSSPTQMMQKLKWNTFKDHMKVIDMCHMRITSHHKFKVSFDHIPTFFPRVLLTRYTSHLWTL